jgi:hypothetical protein
MVRQKGGGEEEEDLSNYRKRRECNLKEEVLDRTAGRTRSGRGCVPVARVMDEQLHTRLQVMMIYIFNRSWVDTRWQQYITLLHTNSTFTYKQYA